MTSVARTLSNEEETEPLLHPKGVHACPSNLGTRLSEIDIEAGVHVTKSTTSGFVLHRHVDSSGIHTESLLKHLADRKSDTERIDYRHDVMMYKNKTLVSWQAFHIGANSVWRSRDLWLMMARLGTISICVAALTVLVVPDPAALKISKFTSATKFLSVMIGLLMGFFLSSSAKRWHNCVNGFLRLLDAIRNMSMQFQALGVSNERSLIVDRYGLASAWLLYGDLLTTWQRFSVSSRLLEKEMWELFAEQHVDLDGSGKVALLDEDEMVILRKMKDPAGIMWMWISNVIGTLAQDGIIPGMATPTYGRIMNLCQDAFGGIRNVRAAVLVQAPLPYTHTLAVLVHINGMINAICLGFVLGIQTGAVLEYSNITFYGTHIYRSGATFTEVAQDSQMLFVTFLFCFFGPLAYQALLIMAFHLSQPFDHEDAAIPLDMLLHRLEVDLRNGNQLLARIPGFTKAFFATPAPKATPKPEATKSPVAVR